MFRKVLAILLIIGVCGLAGCAGRRDLRRRFDVVWWPKDAPFPPHAEKSAINQVTVTPWVKGLKPLPPPPLGAPKGPGCQPIRFGPDQNLIGPAGHRELKQVLAFLNKHKEYHLLIQGYCGAAGNEEYNRALSERRALTVWDYFYGRGLAKDRIHTLSFGGEKPPKKDHTPKALGRSCRVELTLIQSHPSAVNP